MIEVHIGNYALRVWYNESLFWTTADILLEKQAIPVCHAETDTQGHIRQAGVELYRPLGPRFEYGALCGSFLPIVSQELLVEIMGYRGQSVVEKTLLHPKLGSPVTKMDEESVPYIISGIRSLEEILTGGVFRIIGCLYDDVGSANNLFLH
jgi:hypothetical protein